MDETHDSQRVSERLGLLRELADAARVTSPTTEDARGHIDWTAILKDGRIDARECELLHRIEYGTALDNYILFREHPALWQTFIRLLCCPKKQPSGIVSFAICCLYEFCREDLSRYDMIAQQLKLTAHLGIFLEVLESKPDPACSDKAAFILSGIMSRAPWDIFPQDQVKEFAVDALGDGLCAKYTLTTYGKLDLLSNLLKNDANRSFLWAMPYTVELLRQGMKTGGRASPVLQYKSLFVLWLFSLNKRFIEEMVLAGLLELLCSIIKESRVEKVVRVSQHALRNMLDHEGALEVIIDFDIMQVLTLLEYEKWRDTELYDEIKDSISKLGSKIRNFSNLDRYCHELETGRLKWGVLHTEKFWTENITEFEADEFLVIRKLVNLLDSDNPTTLGVVCHDLGEFARLHPAGKKISRRLKVKERVMELVTNKNRDVAREALLCIQKLVLSNWKKPSVEPKSVA